MRYPAFIPYFVVLPLLASATRAEDASPPPGPGQVDPNAPDEPEASEAVDSPLEGAEGSGAPASDSGAAPDEPGAEPDDGPDAGYGSEDWLLPPPPPAPRTRPFELTVGTELTGLGASRNGRIASSGLTSTASLRASYALGERLALLAGYRGGGELSLGTYDYESTTTYQGLAAGARWSERLGPWFEAVAELELEVLDVRTTLALDGATGEDGGVALGLTPRLGIGVSVPLGRSATLRMRLLGGYAWRTATPLDAVVFELPGVSAAPRDLGSLDLSGAQLAFHLGLAL